MSAAIIAFPLTSFAAIMLGWTMVRTPVANVFDGRFPVARAATLSAAAYEGLWAAFIAVIGLNSLIAWFVHGGCFPARCF
ncbi:MAG: hypothetical protein R3C58_11265 [Parvularculaceae bacterium]